MGFVCFQIPTQEGYQLVITVTMTGFLHAISSGVLLLLAITSTMFVHRAGAYSSELTNSPVMGSTTDGTIDRTSAPTASGTTEPEDECVLEQTACVADEVCVDCLTIAAQGDACGDLVDASNSSNPTETCVDNMEIACCVDALSEFECLENKAFVVGVLCFLEAFGCPVDEVTCADDEDDDDGDDDLAEAASDGAASAHSLGDASIGVTFLSCAFMVLWPLLLV